MPIAPKTDLEMNSRVFLLCGLALLPELAQEESAQQLVRSAEIYGGDHDALAVSFVAGWWF